MARKAIAIDQAQEVKVQQEDQTILKNRLNELIPIYGQNKADMDDLKKTVDADNLEIKELCKKLNEEKVEVDGWTATYNSYYKDNINEVKLLEILHKHEELAALIIKTKEYVDGDALEAEIYKGNIDKDILLEIKNCNTPKLVETLTVKKAKEKKK